MSNWLDEPLSRRRVLAGLGGALTTLSVGTGSAMFSMNPLPPDKPTVIGHRGAAGLAPPNTQVSIAKAVEFDVDGVELDVRQTQDGELVLFHDPFLTLTTDKHGIIHRTPSEVVLNATLHGHEILTLREGLSIVREAGIDLYLEVKRPGYTPDVLTAVEEYDLVDQTTIVSFETGPVTTARDSDVPVAVGLIGSTPSPSLLDDAVELNVDIVLSHYVPRATPVFIEKAKSAGLTAGIWSLVDTEHSIRDALEADPDILTTNRPDIVLGMFSQS